MRGTKSPFVRSPRPSPRLFTVLSAAFALVLGLPAGTGQAPARQAALGAGLPQSVPCSTVHKVCGSGLRTVMLGATSIAAGENDVVVAGGMENMSSAPYLLPKARDGYRMGHGQVLDSMVHDGLWDPYSNFHMGTAGEVCAKEKAISRERQDEYAAESYRRAQAAVEGGGFAIIPISLPSTLPIISPGQCPTRWHIMPSIWSTGFQRPRPMAKNGGD